MMHKCAVVVRDFKLSSGNRDRIAYETHGRLLDVLDLYGIRIMQ